MAESKTSERRMLAHDRQLRAMNLRMAGVTFERIAQELGYKGPGGAYEAVMSALDRTLREPADKLRKMELDRLDAVSINLYRMAREGNLGAVDRLLRVMERRARLLGLDAPQVVEWQRTAQEAGLDPAAEFERLVQFFSARMAPADGNGGAEGSAPSPPDAD